MTMVKLKFVDRNSPGTAVPRPGQVQVETGPEEVDIGNELPNDIIELAEQTPYVEVDPQLLPTERFPDTEAEPWHGAMIGAPTDPGERGQHSRTVRTRLMLSTAGWKQRPDAAEFYEAVRAEHPTPRQRAILSTWAAEAEWHELLAAWTEHAYTLRELATALHRAELSRCAAAASLNGWAEFAQCDTTTT